MKAIVIYESMFGNTQEVARAIAEGLRLHLDVETVEVGSAPPAIGEGELLVIGGPTHTFSMSRESTREEAATKGPEPVVSQGIGVREWLESLPASTGSPPAATFDTKVARPALPGSAAKAMQKRLRKKGFRILHPATNFLVEDTDGPLVEGQLDRARQLGDHLGSLIAAEG